MSPMETDQRRKVGRPRGKADRQPYNILLDPEIGEWGKQQPGGLSELVRRLLHEAREKMADRTPSAV